MEKMPFYSQINTELLGRNKTFDLKPDWMLYMTGMAIEYRQLYKNCNLKS